MTPRVSAYCHARARLGKKKVKNNSHIYGFLPVQKPQAVQNLSKLHIENIVGRVYCLHMLIDNSRRP